jgi:hypothetical protein
MIRLQTLLEKSAKPHAKRKAVILNTKNVLLQKLKSQICCGQKGKQEVRLIQLQNILIILTWLEGRPLRGKLELRWERRK